MLPLALGTGVLGLSPANIARAITPVSASIDGTKAVATGLTGSKYGPIAGYQINQNTSPAVTQTDFLDINFAAALDSLVVDLGEIAHFLDLSAVALVPGKVQMIDSNGVDHDLAVWTKTKAQTLEMPGFPPGRYKFTNVSGGALANYKIYIIHTGSKNLL